MAKIKDIEDGGLVLSEQAHQRIKTDIMKGALGPGEKLRLDAVSARYGIGQAPVREALNRLSAEGWVSRRSQRGFFVSTLSLGDLGELVKTRIWLEGKALRESLAHATPEWEDRLILAYHKLARTARLNIDNDVESLSADWEMRHTEFHMQLLANCGSAWLLQFCSVMMDQSVRYRNLSVNFTLARRGDALCEHEAILNAVLDRDADRACALLTFHYEKTLEGLRERLRDATGTIEEL